jgi:hypothetical protein
MDPAEIPLRDLHLPEAIGWWPLAPGWWLLIALAVAGILYLIYRGYGRWRANRPRRVALRELRKVIANYERGQGAIPIAKQLSQLLRRAMMAFASRHEVAGLTGQGWLAWLDRGLDGQPFTTGAGRLIELLPYVRNEDADAGLRVEGLIDAVRQRLRTPLPEARS